MGRPRKGQTRRAVAASASVSGLGATPPETSKSKPARAARVRKQKPSLITRVCKLAKAFVDKGLKVQRLVTEWSGEATPDQQRLHTVVLVALNGATSRAKASGEALEALEAAGFDPTIAAKPRGAKPLAAGATVAFKPKRWRPGLYGTANQFAVVMAIDGMVRLKSAADAKLPQFVVARSWIEEIEAPEVDDPTDAVEDEVEDVGGPGPDPDQGELPLTDADEG
jgi:hypothetical protein